MPSPFMAALADADADIDAELAEQITIVPMRRGEFAEQVDNERPTIDCVALVNHIDPSAADIPHLEARAPYEEFEAQIRRIVLPVGFRIAKGDKVCMLDRPGSPWTRVGRFSGVDPERVTLTLQPIGSEA
jgi:hypothetical protein